MHQTYVTIISNKLTYLATMQEYNYEESDLGSEAKKKENNINEQKDYTLEEIKYKSGTIKIVITLWILISGGSIVSISLCSLISTWELGASRDLLLELSIMMNYIIIFLLSIIALIISVIMSLIYNKRYPENTAIGKNVVSYKAILSMYNMILPIVALIAILLIK